MKFPGLRLRRLRENPLLRHLLEEHRLAVHDLIQPLFIKEGLTGRREISSMPGQYQFSPNEALSEAGRIHALGIPAIILFGVPGKKDFTGKIAMAKNGVVQKAIRSIKNKYSKLLVVTDVCLCEHLSHGHCGHIKNKKIMNDISLKTLAEVALSYARAGADVLAPSDMMDGRVTAIRQKLDKNNFEHTPILSYAVKYASGFYGPFREAAESTPTFGDRSSYQMNPPNSNEALREAKTDLEEGADFILVKPALSYLDVICRVKERFGCPVGAYAVSGEYAMMKAASMKGWIDLKKVVLETHVSMKRAGADFIVTYWSKEIAKWLR